MPASRTVAERLVSDWYPVAWADGAAAPKPVRIEGLPFVRWRPPSGWRVMEDRCPHRNAPLSCGRLLGGHLVCPYHGWHFDGAGRCAWVPAMGRVGKKGWGVPSLKTRVVEGLVFAGPEDRDPPSPALDPGGHRVRLDRCFEAPLDRVAENILDVPHTAVLHGGLFRREARRPIRVRVQREADRVRAIYPEEQPRGLVAKLFGSGPVHHQDEFRLPACARVRYTRGPARLEIASWLCPEDEDRTRMYAQARLEGLDRWAPLLERVVLPVARRILDQDAWILGRQSETVRAFGGPRFIYAHDVLTRHIHQLRVDRREGRQSEEVEEEMELWV